MNPRTALRRVGNVPFPDALFAGTILGSGLGLIALDVIVALALSSVLHLPTPVVIAAMIAVLIPGTYNAWQVSDPRRLIKTYPHNSLAAFIGITLFIFAVMVASPLAPRAIKRLFVL